MANKRCSNSRVERDTVFSGARPCGKVTVPQGLSDVGGSAWRAREPALPRRLSGPLRLHCGQEARRGGGRHLGPREGKTEMPE